MKKFLSLITASAIAFSFAGCSMGYQSDMEAKEAQKAADEEKTESKEKNSENISVSYDNVDVETVNGHIEKLLEDAKESGREDEVKAGIELLLGDLDKAYEAMVYSMVDYYLDWDNESLEDEYDFCGENVYVVLDALGYAFSKGYKSGEYSDLFEKYINDDYLEYYTTPGMSLKRVEGYARVDYEVSDELLDDYYDIAYSDELSEDEKNLQCAELYLDILAGYDPETFYENYNRDYSPEDILKISGTIKQEIFPVEDELISIFVNNDRFEDIYDNPVVFDNPFEVIRDYSSKLSENIEKYANLINDGKLYRLASGDSCYDGSFTDDLPVEDKAIVYVYTDKSFMDLLTAVHEFGHFYASFYDSTRTYEQVTNLDIAEIQSQAFELLFMRFYDDIYGEQSDVMKLVEVINMLDSVINGFLVGEFEYTVLKNIETITPEEIVQCYNDVLGDYAEDYPLYYINHIFEQPGYYISYGVSALAAFDILDDCMNDPAKALEQYEKIAEIPCSSGEYQFESALQKAGFSDVLTDGYIKQLAENLRAFAESF